MREALENDPLNGCIGCGPGNPRGLRLAFHREGDVVTSTLDADATMQGWPRRLHSGVLYTALLETANWTVYGLKARAGLPVRTSALSLARWIATGERLRLLGSLRDTGARTATVMAEARDGQGKTVASLERDYDLPDAVEFAARMGYDAMPPELEGLFPA